MLWQRNWFGSGFGYPLERERRYPNNNFASKSQKEALQQFLLQPVSMMLIGSQVVACRLIWRVTGEDATHAWGQIAANRQACDAAIRDINGVAFFVSSVTGVFNKPSRKGMLLQHIYPALAYWVIHRDPLFPVNQVLSRLSAVAVGQPEVRVIGSTSHTQYNSMSSSLFAVLKDHTNSFILKKLSSSIELTGMPITTENLASSKLVLVDAQLGPFVKEALDNVRMKSNLALLIETKHDDGEDLSVQ